MAVRIIDQSLKEGERMVELDAIKSELSGYDKPLLEMGDSL